MIRAPRGRFDGPSRSAVSSRSLELPDAIQGQLDGFVTDLEARFPTAWRMNAANAAAERAGAAANVDVQRAELEVAASLLRGGLDDPGADRSALESALLDVERALRDLDAAPLDAEAAAAIVTASSGSPEEHADTFRVEVEAVRPRRPSRPCSSGRSRRSTARCSTRAWRRSRRWRSARRPRRTSVI